MQAGSKAFQRRHALLHAKDGGVQIKTTMMFDRDVAIEFVDLLR
jgi:hypothetical protein